MLDAYSVLGVAPTASQAEIEAAYKARLALLHPDRMAGRSKREQEAAAAMLAQLQDAWAAVGTERARGRYDSGRTEAGSPEPRPAWSDPEPNRAWDAEPEPPSRQQQPSARPWTLRAASWPVRAAWRQAGALAAELEASETPALFWWPAGVVALGVVGFLALLIAAQLGDAPAVVALSVGGMAQVWWWVVGARAAALKVGRLVAFMRRRGFPRGS